MVELLQRFPPPNFTVRPLQRLLSSGRYLPRLLNADKTIQRRGRESPGCTPASGPNVWSGRALQEVFVDPVATVLHQCIRPLFGAHCAPGHHGYQRACDLISGQASTGPLGPQAVVVRVAMGGCTRAPYSICGWYGRNCRRPIRVGRCHKRSMTRATCVGDHSPDPRGVGMACAFNPSAMACSDVAPACRNAAMIGTISATRRAARFCSAPRASGASPCRALGHLAV